MARVRVMEQRSAAPATPSGNLLLGLVALGTVFMLLMGLLGTVKTGVLFNEANLLFAALTFYAASTVLYIGFAVTGTERFVRFAWLATWAGFVSNTLAGAHRWYTAGHAPFSSVYEMLLAFIWAVAALTLVRAAQVRGEGDRHHHHAGGGCRRGADAVAAFGSAPAGARAAIHLAAHPCDPGDALLCRLCRQLCLGHDVSHPGQDAHRKLPGQHQRPDRAGLRRRDEPVRGRRAGGGGAEPGDRRRSHDPARHAADGGHP